MTGTVKGPGPLILPGPIWTLTGWISGGRRALVVEPVVGEHRLGGLLARADLRERATRPTLGGDEHAGPRDQRRDLERIELDLERLVGHRQRTPTLFEDVRHGCITQRQRAREAHPCPPPARLVEPQDDAVFRVLIRTAELGQRVPGGFHARQHGSRRLDGQEARRRWKPAQVGVHHASDQWVVVLVPRTHDRGGSANRRSRPRGRTRRDATSARTGSSSRPARSAGAGRSRHRMATHCTSA